MSSERKAWIRAMGEGESSATPPCRLERIRAVLAYAVETFREDRFHLLPPAESAE